VNQGARSIFNLLPRLTLLSVLHYKDLVFKVYLDLNLSLTGKNLQLGEANRCPDRACTSPPENKDQLPWLPALGEDTEADKAPLVPDNTEKFWNQNFFFKFRQFQLFSQLAFHNWLIDWQLFVKVLIILTPSGVDFTTVPVTESCVLQSLNCIFF